MSNVFIDDLKKIGSGIITAEHFLLNVFNDAKRVQDAVNSLPPDAKAVFARIFTDITAAVAAATPAAAAEGLNFTLDLAAYQAILKLVTDAKEGVKVAEAFFSALGISLQST